MKNNHRESLNRILKKLETARDSNIQVTQIPDIDAKAARVYFVIAHVFQVSMGFVDAEIEKLDKSKNKRKMLAKETQNVSR